jgi:acyl-CoA thioesterase-1
MSRSPTDLEFKVRGCRVRGLVLGVLCTGLLVASGCGQGSEPSQTVSRAPSDGFGQRLGHDVTAQPGRGGDAPVSERPKIVAFGDSLTAGLGVSAEESYPAQLQRRLDEAGYRYRVVNAGVSGDTTAGGVRRVNWVLNSRPSIVILELGGNDGLRGIDPDQTKANLEQIIKRLQATGVTVVLAGIKLPPNYGADYISRFEAIYPELARTYHLVLIPFFLEGVATKTALNQADGIHPTGPGYQVIVDHLIPVLEPLLARDRANLQDDFLKKVS